MAKEYTQLLESYRRMFGMVDAFHFNSQNTAEVYARHLSIPTKSEVIPITHSGIKDHRKLKNFDENVLRLGFIGSETPYKGLPLLKNVIEKLNQDGFADALSLAVYGGRTGRDEELPNIYYCGRFTPAMMEEIFSKMDLMVLPSIWNETFGFVVLEAISFGTPVLVSDKVGAMDVVMRYEPDFIYQTKRDLYSTLKSLINDRMPLKNYNRKILNSSWDFSMNGHTHEIVDKMYKASTK